MAYDMTVVRTAYETARSMGASSKIMLALFEAGIVESGFRNLNYGDRDSLGFLQQRPSQGWGTPQQVMDPAYATKKFVEKARQVDRPEYTAGQLAQAVQRSAYPLKYDAVAPAAANLLLSVGGNPFGGPNTVPVGGGDSAFGAIRKAIATVGDPKMWVRIGMFAAGVVLLYFSIWQLTGDNKLGEGTKAVLKLAGSVATKKVK
jgi:hypothetical protein